MGETSPNLPPGYIEWNGETWAMPGAASVFGWQWWDTRIFAWRACRGFDQRFGSIAPTKVRRLIAPATEMVPWWEAKGRQHPVAGVILAVSDGSLGPRALTSESAFLADDDGMVEVLTEGGGS